MRFETLEKENREFAQKIVDMKMELALKTKIVDKNFVVIEAKAAEIKANTAELEAKNVWHARLLHCHQPRPRMGPLDHSQRTLT